MGTPDRTVDVHAKTVRDDDGRWRSARIRASDGALYAADPLTPYSPFGENVVVSRIPVFELSSADPLSILRDVTDGDVTHTVDEYRVNGLVAPARLESAELGRYLPGFTAEVGIGLRLDTRNAGGTVQWGAFDGTDGFRMLRDDAGLHCQVVRAGTVVDMTERADWNVDRLDGDGPSGVDVGGDVDAFLGRGHIWQQRFVWYGYGQIEFQIVAIGRDGKQRVAPLHRARVVGSTSVRQPNMPAWVRADGADVYVGGRQYSVFGRQSLTEVREAGEFRLQQSIAADGAFHPMIAFRRDTSEAWTAGVKITPEDFSVITDQPVVVQVFAGGTATDGAWTGPTGTAAGESAVEVNKTLTAADLSTAIAYSPVVVSGTRNRTGQVETNLNRPDLPRDMEAIVAARVIGGQAATVSSTLAWLESR